VEGTLNVLLNAEECNAFFVFVSTDFVFDGITGMYREEHRREPVNFYGRTKVEAEDAVMEYNGDWSIVRTVLVYGKPQVGRQNILTIVRQKLEKGEAYSVVDDQVRTPTYVEDLADGICRIIGRKAGGVFHISGEEVLTPYQMASEAAELLGLPAHLLKRVTADTFSQPARRPAVTGFDITKAKELLGFAPVSFREGLRRMFAS
jgi:dTDP-4-dehydrorhamnose reductase